jgi:hypothetical protein
MAYTDFTLDDIELKFGVRNRVARLFETLPPIEPSDWLKRSLTIAASLPIRSEKAKSESIVFPMLVELRERNDNFFTIYSGDNLNADKDLGLYGECDFVLAKDVGSFSLTSPIMQIVEAKRNDIEDGVRQCAAQLIGAKFFNAKKNVSIEPLYGCATTGDDWLFLKLDDSIVVDSQKYYLNAVGELLAVFQYIIDYYKRLLK